MKNYSKIWCKKQEFATWCMAKNEFRCRKSAFSLAEVMVVLIIMAGILLMLGRVALGDRQKEYDAKINKTTSVISANITKDLVENTGAEFADYALNEAGNEYFQSAVKNNLNQMKYSIRNLISVNKI